MGRNVLPAGLVAVLIIGAFAAGYLLRAQGERVPPVTEASSVAQPPPSGSLSQTPPSPGPTSGSSPKDQGQRKEEKGEVRGTIETVSGGVLVIRVTQAPGLGLQQGARVNAELTPKSTLTREITPADLKAGSPVALRGLMEGGKFLISQLTITLTR